MIGAKPGEKSAPRTRYVPEQKPAKKVEKNFVPSCIDKRPAHWGEVEKATKKVVAPGMKYTTSPTKKTKPLIPGEQEEEAEWAEEEQEQEVAADAGQEEEEVAAVEA